jgi:hypothetical protein
MPASLSSLLGFSAMIFRHLVLCCKTECLHKVQKPETTVACLKSTIHLKVNLYSEYVESTDFPHQQQWPACGLMPVDARIFSGDLVIRELDRGSFYNTIWTV